MLNLINTKYAGKTPSMQSLALVMGMPTTKLIAVAKEPIDGSPATGINWTSLTTFCNQWIASPDNLYCATMDDLIREALERDAKLGDKRGVSRNMVEVDGQFIQRRKASMFEMGDTNESLICLAGEQEVYKMVYQTLSFTVLRAVNPDGSFATEDVRALSNKTLNAKCVHPFRMKDEIAKRFGGTK